MLSPYQFQENNEFSYEFISEKGLKYALYFLDYSFMFSNYPHIANNIYSFNIEVLEGNSEMPAGDERIGVTILEVFKIFFSKISNIAVYVCDSIDDRHLGRKRKFNYGFGNITMAQLLKKMALL